MAKGVRFMNYFSRAPKNAIGFGDSAKKISIIILIPKKE
jgi:hypothetical protein